MARKVSGRAAGNLTAAVTSFVGRRREIAEIRRCLSASRLVTLNGVGGVGKTRLAIEAADRARKAFADGVWLIDLAPVTDAALIAQAAATALGVRDQSARPALHRLIEYVADWQLLMVLDNCEHLLDGCAEFADAALRAVPGLRVLATSRQSLGIAGEHVFTVPPLGVPPVPARPDEPPAAVPALLRYEAVALFTERAAAVAPGFALTEQNRDAVARLCAGLDGLPLAIELATTRLRTLSEDQLLQRLQDRFALLNTGSRVAAPRQRTLRALIDWSHELCSAEERRLWARLSVFTGGFDLEAAETVCAGDGLDRERILDLVDQLVTRSIINRTGAAGMPRLGMLETLREYGSNRLAASGEGDKVRARHRTYFLRLAQRSADGWCAPGQEATLARLRADHGNLRAAFDHCVADPDGAEAALALCAALRWQWCADGFLAEGRRWLDLALGLPARPGATRAEALWVCAWVACLQGDLDAARSRLDECLELADRIGDARSAAYAAGHESTAALFRGLVPEAAERYRAAAARLEALGEIAGVLHTLFQLAIALAHRGEYEEAETVARRAIGASERHGEHLHRSYALWALAFGTWLRGDPGEAGRQVLAGLRLQAGFRDSVGAALMIEMLAWIAGAERDFTRAARLLGTAHSIWRSAGTGIATFGPQLARHHEWCERRSAGALGEPGFRAAFEAGMRPTVEDAIAYVIEQPAAGPPASRSSGGLTRREHQIAELLGEGLSNRSIAERLVVSPRTVDGHVQNVLAKLGFTSRAQVAAWVTEQRERP